MKEFTTKHLIKLGINRERLRDWVNRGYVVPSLHASGQGHKNIFSEKDLFYLLVFQRMVEFGISRDEAKDRLLDLSRAFLLEEGGYWDPAKPFLVFFKNPLPPDISKSDVKELMLIGYLRASCFFMDLTTLKDFLEKNELIIDDMVVLNLRKIRDQIESLN